MSEIANIIEALSRHSDNTAVSVLDEIGTNSTSDLVRELTAKALINRNTHDALRVVLINKGKGIHDLNAKVVETSINTLISLKDKSEAMKILDDTISMHSDETVKFKALQVREIISNN